MPLIGVKEYNGKVNIHGRYLPYSGWSTISFIENGHNSNVNLIETFLKEDPVMSKYFAALPRDSYHVTIHNLWANGNRLLPHQKRFLEANYSNDEKTTLIEQSKRKGFWNPDFCMNELLKKIDKALPKLLTSTELIIGGVYFTGHTLGIWFSDDSDMSNFDLSRVACINASEKMEDVPYHMTLAYNYKDVDIREVRSKLQELNNKLAGIHVKMAAPFVSYFSDMTMFVPYTYMLHLRCNEPPTDLWPQFNSPRCANIY